MSYKVTFPTRWADFDPNNHMRHSAYNLSSTISTFHSS